MNFRAYAKRFTDAPFSRQVMQGLLDHYKRPGDKISELIKAGDLIALRRGLYVPGPHADLPVPHVFVVANHLRGPSYVSLESALSYWGLIPERVIEISSVTIKTSKIYKTAVGRFSYTTLPPLYYSFGIKRVYLTSAQTAMMASPEKAICDKIVTTAGVVWRSPAAAHDFLVEDLRIDAERLKTLDRKMICSWLMNAPKENSLHMMVKMLEKL